MGSGRERRGEQVSVRKGGDTYHSSILQSVVGCLFVYKLLLEVDFSSEMQILEGKQRTHD